MEPYQRLEREWAQFNGLDPAGMVACSSGTAALHLALEAFRLPPGSECLTPDYTMVACPRAVALAGLTPVFVDCGDDLLLDCDAVSSALGGPPSDWPKALMAVHIYGRREDVGWLRNFGQFRIVEDLAEAHGVRPHPLTDAACWSFFHNKIIGGQEGGAVWFRDPAHADLARQLRCLGFTDAHDYDHVPRGHNYRLANVLAGLILRGLEQYRYPCDRDIGWPGASNRGYEQRREIESWYDAACPPEWRQPARDAVWTFDLRVPGCARDRVLGAVRALRAAGVEARPGFLPMARQAEFRHCRRVGGANADRAADEVLYLPVQPGVTTPESVRMAFDVLRRELRE